MNLGSTKSSLVTVWSPVTATTETWSHEWQKSFCFPRNTSKCFAMTSRTNTVKIAAFVPCFFFFFFFCRRTQLALGEIKSSDSCVLLLSNSWNCEWNAEQTKKTFWSTHMCQKWGKETLFWPRVGKNTHCLHKSADRIMLWRNHDAQFVRVE